MSMKAWEVLKAVDEGKIVQYFSTIADNWIIPTIGKWDVEAMAEYKWRIKPEPRVLYVNEQSNGLFSAYTSESTAKSMRSGHCVGKTLKFVEEVSE